MSSAPAAHVEVARFGPLGKGCDREPVIECEPQDTSTYGCRPRSSRNRYAAETPGQHSETPVTGHTRINHADMKSPAQQQDSACLLNVTFSRMSLNPLIRAHLHRFISPRQRVLVHRATLPPRFAATYAFTVHGSSRNVGPSAHTSGGGDTVSDVNIHRHTDAARSNSDSRIHRSTTPEFTGITNGLVTTTNIDLGVGSNHLLATRKPSARVVDCRSRSPAALARLMTASPAAMTGTSLSSAGASPTPLRRPTWPSS